MSLLEQFCLPFTARGGPSIRFCYDESCEGYLAWCPESECDDDAYHAAFLLSEAI